MDEERYRGRRSDGANLIQQWQDDRKAEGKTYQYVWNRTGLLAVDNRTEYLMGLFEGSHCEYNLEADKTTEPTFSEMVEKAIKVLSNNNEGYFLFAEGSI